MAGVTTRDEAPIRGACPQLGLAAPAPLAHLAESLGALDLALGYADLAQIDQTMAAAVPVGGPTPEAWHEHHLARSTAAHFGTFPA